MKTVENKPHHLIKRDKLLQLFYQRLSMTDIMPSYFAYNLTISHANKFIWFRVAKVGTRSVYNHLKDQGISLDVEHAYHIRYPLNRYRDYFKFAFVRNPWDRLISGWQNKIVDKNAFKFKTDLHMKLQDFDYFLHYLDESDFLQNNVHFVPQYTLIDLNNLDYLGRLERFEADFEFICTRIGIDKTSAAHRNRSSRSGGYRQCYSDTQAHIVETLYRKDVQLFGYDF